MRKRKRHSRLTPEGAEILDPVPVAPPVGKNRAQTLREQVQDMIRQEKLRYAMNAEAETFEESDDFEMDDEDADPWSPYEEMPPEPEPAPPPTDELDSRVADALQRIVSKQAQPTNGSDETSDAPDQQEPVTTQ